MSGGRSPPGRRSEHQDHAFFGLRAARWKLVLRDRPAAARGPLEVRLFDLESDPGETVDRAPHRPLLRAGLALLLERALRQPAELRAGPPEGMSEEDEEMLRSLGYLGS